MSFLLGHTEYYPRFGYQMGVYGVSSIEVPSAGRTETTLQTRAPVEADISALRELWLHEEGNVDFVVEPGDTLFDWLSPNPNMECAVYLRDAEIVGYTRVLMTEPSSPRLFLAKDADAARVMAQQLIFVLKSIKLPLHPYSASASVFGTPQVTAWNAGMACSLAPGIFDEFYVQLQASKRLPGRVIWTTAFDLA